MTATVGRAGGRGQNTALGGLKEGPFPCLAALVLDIWGLTGLGTDPFLSPPRAPEGLKRLRGFAERAPRGPAGGGRPRRTAQLFGAAFRATKTSLRIVKRVPVSARVPPDKREIPRASHVNPSVSAYGHDCIYVSVCRYCACSVKGSCD